MKNIFKNEKFWLVAAGAAGVIVGKKIITAKKTRQLAVKIGRASCRERV